MKLKLQIAIIGLLVLSFSSCQKNLEKEDFDPPQEIVESDDSDDKQTIVENDSLAVDWYTEKQELDWHLFFADIDDVAKQFPDESLYTLEFIQIPDAPIHLYELGSVSEGEYDGYKYMLLDYGCEGMCFGDDYFKFLTNSSYDDWIYLSSVSDPIDNAVIESFYDTETDLEVIGVSSPDELSFGSYNYELRAKKYKSQQDSLSESDMTPVQTFEGNNAYLNHQNGCVYLQLADFTYLTYSPSYEFWSESQNEYGFTYYQLDIDLKDGTDLSDETYNIRAIACGGSNSCLNIVNEDSYSYYEGPSIEESLELVGLSSSGQDIYAMSDLNHPIVRNMLYYEEFQGYDENSQVIEPIEKKREIGDLDEKYIQLFFRTQFDQLAVLTNQLVIPPAECGKPVIYLYPEDEMEVSVKVNPLGGVTVSDPDYGDGWKVKASPDGNLFHPETNACYTSLFWESNSYGDYIAQAGFLISEANKKYDLDQILIRYGLNSTEREEFLDYWVKKLQGYDYYYASLLPQSELDAIAPLDIEPKPDRIYRLFFNFYPAYEGFEYIEPTVNPIVRQGFTVVEWGGSF